MSETGLDRVVKVVILAVDGDERATATVQRHAETWLTNWPLISQRVLLLRPHAGPIIRELRGLPEPESVIAPPPQAATTDIRRVLPFRKPKKQPEAGIDARPVAGVGQPQDEGLSSSEGTASPARGVEADMATMEADQQRRYDYGCRLAVRVVQLGDAESPSGLGNDPEFWKAMEGVSHELHVAMVAYTAGEIPRGELDAKAADYLSRWREEIRLRKEPV